MTPLKILHIPFEVTEEQRNELIRVHSPRCIVTTTGIISESDQDNLKICRYTPKELKEKFEDLCSQLRAQKEINWIIVIHNISNDKRNEVLNIIQKMDVIITNKESGDILFMPCQTFWRSNWTVVKSDYRENQDLNCDETKNQIFSTYIRENLILQEIHKLKRLLGMEKSTIPSPSETIHRICVNSGIQSTLEKLQKLEKLTEGPLVEKIEYLLKEQEPRGTVISHIGFILMRRVCGKIFDIIMGNGKALQHFKHALYFAFKTETFEEFKKKLSSELCELFQIKPFDENKLENRLSEHGLQYLYTSLMTTDIPKKELESELYKFLQNEIFTPSLKFIQKLQKLKNQKERKLINIKNTVSKSLETKTVNEDKKLRDTGYSKIPDILREACNSLDEVHSWAEDIGIECFDVKKIFPESIRKACDGKMVVLEKMLNLFTDENKRIAIEEEFRADMRKEDYEIIKKNYKADCGKSYEKLPDQRIMLIVVSEHESTQNIRPIEIERTLHTGKWNHCGLDGVTKRMIKTYMSQSKVNKQTLVDFCNIIYHSYPLDMSEDIRKTCLRLKYDKYKEAEVKYVYRPISMATQFFNLVDKVIHLRLLDWIWQNKSLPDNSFSYQKRKSAPFCRNKLLLKIAELIKSKMYWYVTSVDFKQAYENVDPLKLCQLMILKGIPLKIVSWVWFALRERKLTLAGGEEEFSRSKGVPQGSSMSPLLFNIYTALIHEHATEDTFIYQYTDDVLVLGTDNHNFQQARRKSEAVCYEVVSLMIKYDAVLKKESQSKVKFVGLEINNPQNKTHCTDIEKVFETFFESMKTTINSRVDKVMKGGMSLEENNTENTSIHPADAWHQYHIRVRPLFSKVFVTLQILCKIADPDNTCPFLTERIDEFDNLNVSCLQKCLLLNENYTGEPHALRYEFGEFPARIQMEEAFASEFSRYYYYGLFDGNIDLPAIVEIKNLLKPVSRMADYPTNIIVKDKAIIKKDWADFDYVVYTDGSVGKFNEKYVAGASAYFAKKPEGFSFKDDRVEDESKSLIGASVKLSSDLMISSVEIIATIIAIEKIQEYLDNAKEKIETIQKILIVVDREEALMQLRERQRTRHIHYYAEMFKSRVRALETRCEVTLGKVKAHSRSDENNRADEFAKKVSRNMNAISEKFLELNLVDFKRKKHREFREKYQRDLNEENINTFLEFRFKPWFKQRRVKALQLSSDTCKKYIKDRLSYPNDEELKNWMYFHSEYQGKGGQMISNSSKS